ncbi:hypothetical protein FQA39_LY07870 [Lamprigera yunnana]|nr:hypothetical protein FQA39_LY07870 [Lamprigera yunnana]
MCGIFCACTTKSQQNDLLPIYNCLKSMLERRGPDHCGCEEVTVDECCLLFGANVLWTQGKCITEQPIIDNQSVLVYNGDIFEGISVVNGDTLAFCDLLKNGMDVDLLSNIKGPFSFIYLDKRCSKLYFARDAYGRRSLLLGLKEKTLIVSSIARKLMEIKFIELPAIGVFTYDLKSNKLQLAPWRFHHSNNTDVINNVRKLFPNFSYTRNCPDILQKRFLSPNKDDLIFLQQLETHKPNEIFEIILNNVIWLRRIICLKELLQNAIKLRIKTLVQKCFECSIKTTCDHSAVGVLFSGGVDCSILTLLMDEFVSKKQSVDLINVSFRDGAPDRETGLQTLEELKILRPDRNWNFVELNVTEGELKIERENFIADLIYPLNTILDESLGCALWFAARAEKNNYTSPCRILIVGMGADELFGGYMKHRAAFKHSQWEGLHQSLETDWENISFRNLGRDDRVVSDHGRQLHTPYLDENVVEFVRCLNCWERTCPTEYLPQGIGDKIILRSLAYHLGLKNAASFRKRALQFGSRIANNKENAIDVSPRL